MTPTLYIMVRNDMHSMTGGKAAAQASHAANDFEYYLTHSMLPPWVESAVLKWREGRTFGRALVLGADEYEMDSLIVAHDNKTYSSIIPQHIFGYIIDTTYPVLDGKITHLVPVQTAAWLFTYDNAKTVHDVASRLHSRKHKHGDDYLDPEFLPLQITAGLKLFK